MLLDLNLGDSAGLPTIDRLQKAAPDVPIVVLTGLGDGAVGLEAVRHGAQDYLVKGEVDTNLLVRSLQYAYERHQTDQQLKEREARLRLFTEQVPAILWSTDFQLKFTSAQGRGLEALGLRPDEVREMTLPQFFRSDDPNFPPLVMHQQALDGKESSQVVKWSDRWYQTHVEPLRDLHGKVAGTIGVALDITDQQRMEQSLTAAQKIQEYLLPKTAPEYEGFDIAGACLAAEKCSGDYFDFIPMSNGQLAIVLADASGHGFGPAILAATVRSYLRSAALQGREIHEMLTVANWLLVADSAPDQFVTLFCVQIDAAKSTFVYAAAGHQAYLVDAHGLADLLKSNCMPLGIEENEMFPLSQTIVLRAGDILLLCTDGILEAQAENGEQFGHHRLIKLVHQKREKSAADTVKSIYKSVRHFTKDAGPQADDLTAVVVKVNPGSEDDTV